MVRFADSGTIELRGGEGTVAGTSLGYELARVRAGAWGGKARTLFKNNKSHCYSVALPEGGASGGVMIRI